MGWLMEKLLGPSLHSTYDFYYYTKEDEKEFKRRYNSPRVGDWLFEFDYFTLADAICEDKFNLVKPYIHFVSGVSTKSNIDTCRHQVPKNSHYVIWDNSKNEFMPCQDYDKHFK